MRATESLGNAPGGHLSGGSVQYLGLSRQWTGKLRYVIMADPFYV